MDIFHSRAQLVTSPLITSPMEKASQRRPSRLGLRLCLGLLPLLLTGGSLWCLQATLMPPAAVAYTTRLNLFLSREQGESFDALVRRAEIIARAGVQRSFDADVLAGEAIVTVVAENQGITVPLLTVEVSRAQWQAYPDVEYWARYYETAKALLEL